jgi:pantoate--beta-alanine ligase
VSTSLSIDPAPAETLPIEAARTVAALREQVAAWRRDGLTIALVPTMGALHEGHLTLVRVALGRCDRVVVSIFVNPQQFGPAEDFSTYPRREAEDAAKLVAVGAHLLFAPAVEAMYPPGFATHVAVDGLADHLCGPHRPGHFRGVATVVTKLLLQTLPDLALFGEKDYQQLQVIKQLARDLDIPASIEGVPTVREADGLALSSRNVYLSPEERAQAAVLPRVLRQAAEAAALGGNGFASLINRAVAQLTVAKFGPIDYVTIADAVMLQPVDRLDRPARIFGAAWLGRTRLIDNFPIG